MMWKKLSEANRTNDFPMYTHRKFIGFLGFILPVACIIIGWDEGGMGIQRSISAYYHTVARDVFIAVMVLVSGFMLTYRGYDLWDRIVTDISGIFAALTALFPTIVSKTPELSDKHFGIFQLQEKLSGDLHLISAALLFAFFAVQCIFLFTKSPNRWRKIIYYICGGLITVCLLVLLVLFIPKVFGGLQETRIVFILEVVMLAAFGLAWVIKGRVFSKAYSRR